MPKYCKPAANKVSPANLNLEIAIKNQANKVKRLLSNIKTANKGRYGSAGKYFDPNNNLITKCGNAQYIIVTPVAIRKDNRKAVKNGFL